MAELNCLIFYMNGSLYAVEVEYAGSVGRDVKLQRLPGIPDCLLGIATIRDEVVPVVSLRKHFGLPPISAGTSFDVIIGKLDGRTTAYQVDSIRSISPLEFDESNEAPDMIRYITGCVQKVTMLDGSLVVLLDLPNVLSAKEREAIASFMDAMQNEEDSSEAPDAEEQAGADEKTGTETKADGDE